MKKKIHVNQHNIRHNNKTSKYENTKPIITVKTYKQNIYGYSVNILGESKVMYPEKPLSCGARVWIETTALVEVLDINNEIIDVL